MRAKVCRRCMPTIDATPNTAIIERLKDTFANLYGAQPGHITESEYAEAEALVTSKFATDSWLHRVP